VKYIKPRIDHNTNCKVRNQKPLQREITNRAPTKQRAIKTLARKQNKNAS